jgi:arylsulfatase A-like enzyme/Flp pilus assembly protein TadD
LSGLGRRPTGIFLPVSLAFLAFLTGCSRPPLNVLLVTLDTTRADHIGCYGFALAQTPRMDGLAREGVRCADAISAAPITLPSHSTILTGLYPPAHGVRDNGSYALGDDAVTLAERLKKAGYRTQAIVSALVLNRRYNLVQGFDGYDDDLWSEDEAKLFMIRSRPGERTAERATAWLDGWSREAAPGKSGKRRPFFLWMHLFDAHQPYSMKGADRSLSPSAYDAEIGVLDRSVGRVLDELKKLGTLDDTLVIITADHGESLGEHGEKTHAVFIYDATVRVPLLLRCPRVLPAGKVYAAPVRSVDLVPTILAALDLPGGTETQGTNLLPALRGDVPPPQLPQYSESLLSEVGFGMAPLYGVRLGGFKWIRAPKPEVYDLARDPQEVANLYPAEARRGANLDRELAAILADSKRRALAPQKSPMDKETLESLQALGYLAPRASREAMQGIDPKDGMPLYTRLEDARHLAQEKKWPESEKMLRDLLRDTPNNVTAVNILALVLTREGDFAAARAEYLHSLALDPKQSRVHAMLGTLSLLGDDLDAAERSYRRALEITPGFVEAISNLGMIAALRGDNKTAEEEYRKAIAADPGFPRVYRRLADLYYERGDFAKALDGYHKTLAAEPDDFQATVQAASAARHTGDLKAASDLFARAVHLRPDSWIPIYNQACLAAVEGDPARSLGILQNLAGKKFPRLDLLEKDPDLTAVRRLPGYPPLFARLKAAHASQGDEEEVE